MVTQMVGRHVEEAAEARQVTPSATLEANVTRAIKTKVYVPEEKWDADPDLLVFLDCALRVSTGEVSKHHPKHYVTNAFPYDYPDGERSELWEGVVCQLLREREAAFFQEYCGYCLTTSVRHQIMLWLVGMPGGGKSTLILGAREMLGPRCGTLGLTHLQGSGARFALSNLPGKTLMTCTENPSGYLKTTEILNSLVTGDPIRVERKN